MYLDYYQLSKEPFYITPDPAFLFLSESHKQAMANIVYGIGMKKGLMVIIGDIGVGKTMIAQALLARSDREFLKTIYMDNADVSFENLLQTICRNLGLPATNNTSEDLNRLRGFLIDQDMAGRTVALFIDDAHTMPDETLDNLVFLSNLETKDKKLLQIVLIGQPKLNALLDKNELRHIKQRIAIRSTIAKLTPAESLAYVKHRLEKAGADDTSAFTKTALERILKVAGGIPRVINVLCDNALVNAYGHQAKSVTTQVANEAITDLMGSERRWYFKYLRWQTGVLVALMCMSAMLLVAYHNGYFTSRVAQRETGGVLPPHNQTVDKPASTFAVNQNTIAQVASQPSQDKKTPGATLQQANAVHPSNQVTPQVSPKITAPKSGSERSKKMVKIKVKQGDSFIQLIKEYYGRTDKELLAYVKSKNSHIQDLHNLRQGTVLYFPNTSEILKPQ